MLVFAELNQAYGAVVGSEVLQTAIGEPKHEPLHDTKLLKLGIAQRCPIYGAETDLSCVFVTGQHVINA